MYIKEAQELNLKSKVEFLVMATELIEIKAYSILNKGKKGKGRRSGKTNYRI